MYNYEDIQDNLTTKYVGQTFVQFDELKSVHQKAKNISSNCPDGMLVLTEFQQNVKLKGNKTWYELDGDNLFFSLIFKTNSKSDNSQQLLQIVNASVVSAIKKLDNNISCAIKWPNDILINNKKFCSCFVENINKKDNSSLIVSIYMNIEINETEQNEEVITNELLKGVTSVKEVYPQDLSKELLISDILNNIEIFYDEFLKTKCINSVIDIFDKNNVVLGKSLGVKKANKKTIKTVNALDLNQKGQLLVLDKNNSEIFLNNEEDIIEWWINDKEA